MTDRSDKNRERVAAALERFLDNVRGGTEAFERRQRARRRAMKKKGRRRPSEAELKEALRRGKRWV